MIRRQLPFPDPDPINLEKNAGQPVGAYIADRAVENRVLERLSMGTGPCRQRPKGTHPAGANAQSDVGQSFSLVIILITFNRLPFCWLGSQSAAPFYAFGLIGLAASVLMARSRVWRSDRDRRALHGLKPPKPAGGTAWCRSECVDRKRVEAAQLRRSAVVPNTGIEAHAKAADRQVVTVRPSPRSLEIDRSIVDDAYSSDLPGRNAIYWRSIGDPDAAVGVAFGALAAARQHER